MKEGREVDVLSVELRQRPARFSRRTDKMTAHSLVHDDTDRVVQDALAKDDRVQLGVDFVRVEDGEDGHWVGGGES
jgi:hypothetical protein